MQAIDANALSMGGVEIALDPVGGRKRAIDGQLQTVVEFAEVGVDGGLTEIVVGLSP